MNPWLEDLLDDAVDAWRSMPWLYRRQSIYFALAVAVALAWASVRSLWR